MISETRCDEMACQYVLRCHVVLTFLNSVRVWGQLTHPPAEAVPLVDLMTLSWQNVRMSRLRR